MGSDTFSKEDILKALEKTIAHNSFVRSPRLADFLTYIVENKLADKAEAIKAYTIAIDVFGRASDFDPQTDSIVRVQANRLRRALNEVYRSGELDSDIYITLPTGRYVPQFVTLSSSDGGGTIVEPTSSDALENFDTNVGVERKTNKHFFGVFVVFMLSLSLIGGALVAWQFSLGTLKQPAQFEIDRQQFSIRPTLIVRDFEDATGVIRSGEAFGQFSRRLASVLISFDNMDVRVEHPGKMEPRVYSDGRQVFVLGGVVKRGEGALEMGVWIKRPDTGEIIWRFNAREVLRDPSYTAIISELVVRIAAEVGAASGPVHRGALSYWIHQDGGVIVDSGYPCFLLFSQSHGRSNLKQLKEIKSCFGGYLIDQPSDLIARTAISVLETLEILETTAPGDNLDKAFFQQLMVGLEAVVAYQTNSFVREQYARMLEFSRDIVGAEHEFVSALNHNPANTDALAALALMQVSNGNWAGGMRNAEKALSLQQSPPAWYYTARALDSLRLSHEDQVVENALILLPVDAELALTLIVAAAPGAARSDLVERYAYDLLSMPQLQSQGILPRISARIHDEKLLTAIRIGLVRAGFTNGQLDGPYQID